MVAEVFLASLLQFLLDKLTYRDFVTFADREGIRERLEKWKAMLYAIYAVLYDADEKQLTSNPVKLWLDDLRDLTYDVEDVLEKFSTEMLRQKMEEHHQPTKSKVWSLIPACCTSCTPSKTMFMLSVESEIDEITDRLQEMSVRKDKLGLTYSTGTSTMAWRRPPSSCLLDGSVVGRDDDEAKIVELLSRDEPGSANFHVIAIVGMAGVGKTTLAQLVFNNKNDAMRQFKKKVWVSVSDDFDVAAVTKAILESLTSRQCDLEEFNNVQENLSRELPSKKFLIALDDVWNTCDYDLWTKLQSPFHVGAPGSKITVTTRDAKVAKTVGATEVHNLKCIANDDCWKIFKKNAFLNIPNDIRPKFELLQEKVVEKCNGLPLSAKTLGGLLCCKEIDIWEEILNNKLWSLSAKSDILPVLKLSYSYLPSHLKRCFAYCAILPNDYEFEERQLILLWMAEGLIYQGPEDNKDMEDLGGVYFWELLSRSLFQKSSKNNSRYVMHDLVGDLAKWAARGICFTLEDEIDDDLPFRSFPKARHSSYIPGKYEEVKKFDVFFKAKCLRTFLPITLSDVMWPRNNLTCMITLDLLPKLPYLRVLSLKGYRISVLPNSIGELKYLRYLDLSHTQVTSLPESASSLYNLQTLILEKCYDLKALPTNMGNLINLRHLNISDVPLEGMPLQLGQLSNLKTLTNFVVGKGCLSKIREIGPLLHLQGTLIFSRLENVANAEDASMAELIGKEGLDALVLQWSGKCAAESYVLDKLEPHKNLKELTVMGYDGVKFSRWIGDPLFSNMMLVSLEYCNSCRSLPPLGQLPSLKQLYIRRMPGVERVASEFYGNGSLSFPLLETLVFEDMKHWKEWWVPSEPYQGIVVFPCLKTLSITRCPKLEGTLPQNLDSLAKLEIDACKELVVSLTNYNQLCELDIDCCKGVVYTSAVDFELLESIRLSNVSEFRLLKLGFMRGLKKLKDLEIIGCEELTSSWQNEDKLLQGLISLRCLMIKVSSHLVPLHHLISLQELHMEKCPSLVSFPQAAFPPSLQVVTILHCQNLVSFARFQIPPSLRRIKISGCEKLKAIVEEEVDSSSCSLPSSIKEKASCLEYLEIIGCSSLMSLSSPGGQLPRSLKHLEIVNCEQLESITNSFRDNTSLQYIYIWTCPNLKFLPEGLCYLTNLQSLFINRCGSLVSFPKGGLPRQALLESVEIRRCPQLAFIPEEGLPFSLGRLIIERSPLLEKRCKPLRGPDWHSIAHIPHMKIGDWDISHSTASRIPSHCLRYRC